MANVILFGGAFDPPHYGHAETAMHAQDYMRAQLGERPEMWFLPSYSDAFGQKEMAPPEHRVAMLEILIKFEVILKAYICTKELEMQNNAGVYVVAKHITKVFPEHQFYFLIGMDCAHSIRKWRNSRKLLKLLPFIVARRRGVGPWVPYLRHPPHMTMPEPSPLPKSNFNSTAIRRSVEMGLPAHKSRSCLLSTPRPIVDYIDNNKLYRKKEKRQ